MTTIQIARIFKARLVGKGKYSAKCPAHQDRVASLEIKEGRKRGLTIVGCYAGCYQADVLAAVGLRQRDLFEDSDWKPTPEIRQRWSDEDEYDAAGRALVIAEWLGVLEPGKRNYWRAVARNYFEQWYWLRCKLEPEWKQQREHDSEVQRIIAEYGEDELWSCLPASVFDLKR
jgi:hypothetical protein